MENPVSVFLALGSNLGRRRRTIRSAIESLRHEPGITVTCESGVIETDPVGPGPQPRYLNAAIELTTTLRPRALLDVLLRIEREHGRKRSEPWGARTLDLDILLYGTVVMDEPGLTIPHPRMHERAFVLEPLAEIAEDVRHPVFDLTVGALLDRLRADTKGDTQ